MSDSIKYEVIDKDLMTTLSIRSENGFLALIDSEVLDDDGLKPNYAESVITPNDNNNGVVNVLDSIRKSKSIAITNIKTDNKEIEFEQGFEEYKRRHPNDPFALGHYILSLP